MKLIKLNQRQNGGEVSNKIITGGDVIVNEIKVGDTIYEYEFNIEIKTTVKTLPTRNEDGLWEWVGETDDGNIVNYAVHEDYPHYSPKLYTYQAYSIGFSNLK